MELGRNPRVRITGTNLRPFMRVAFNDQQGRTFLIGSTTSAEVDLPDLQPGVYDVVLYDYAQELSRLPKALEIVEPLPAAQAELVATGQFIGLSKTQVSALQKGMKFASVRPNSAELLAFGDAAMATARVRSGDTLVSIGLEGQYQVPAAIRLACWFENNADGSLRCVTAGRTQAIAVSRDSVLNLQKGGTAEYFNFQVADVFPVAAPQFTTVRVRATLPAVLARVRAGDRDVSGPTFEGAWVGSVVSTTGGGEVTLRLPVQRVGESWQYRTHPLKAGRPLHFETADYVIDGVILEVGEPIIN
jgi:hypothetical protein